MPRVPILSLSALLLLAVGGCGGSAASPSSSNSARSLVGHWAGTFRYVSHLGSSAPGSLAFEIVPGGAQADGVALNGTVVDPYYGEGTVEGYLLDGPKRDATVVFTFPDRRDPIAVPGTFAVGSEGRFHIAPDFSVGGAPESLAYADFDLTRVTTP